MGYNASIHLDWGVFFELEVPGSTLKRPLPTGIEPSRLTNGNLLISLNLAHFLPGGDQTDLPENHEIDLGMIVAVDNSGHDGQPQAGSAVHLLNIGSTSAGYLDICQESGYPTSPMRGLRFDIQEDGLSGLIHDQEGTILAFSPLTQALDYERFTRVGQDVIHDHRGEYRLNYVFEGEGLKQTQDDCFSLTLHQHPFFASLELDTASPHCHSQFALQTGKRASIRFYGPESETD